MNFTLLLLLFLSLFESNHGSKYTEVTRIYILSSFFRNLLVFIRIAQTPFIENRAKPNVLAPKTPDFYD